MVKFRDNNKRIWKYVMPGLGAAAITLMLIPTQKVAAANDAGKTMAVYSLNSNDPYASDTLKTKVIVQLAQDNSKINLDKVDMDNSQVAVSGLNTNRPGIQAVTIKVGLVYTGDDSKTLGYSITETAAINVIKTYNPTLKLKKSTVVVNNGDAWNPSSYISTISDDSGTLPVLKEVDNVDMSTDGDYYASYTAVNAQGYSTSAVLNVIVKTPQEVLDARAEEEAQAQADAAKAKAEEEAKAALELQLKNSSGSSTPVYGTGGANPYPGTFASNCTYAAWQCVYDYLGVSLPNFGNAWDWLYTASADGYSTGTSPKVGSVAVYSHHVAYVDQVSADGSSVHVIEGNAGGQALQRWVPWDSEPGQALQGYIYIK